MLINETSWQQLKKDVGLEAFPLIIDSFVQEIQTHTQSLNQAVAQHNVPDIAEIAHSVKSSARTLGLDEIADCSQQTETSARSGDEEGAVIRAATLLSLLGQAVAVINDKFNQESTVL